jgi:2-polyprenyl-3-methyl-5-hydroxy-6-metoxy-1,4-benzoquinol methylase
VKRVPQEVRLVSAEAKFRDVPIGQVQQYWNSRPCNIRHSARPIGTREYFDEVEARKYFVEPHIPRLAEFPRWKGKRVLEIGCGIGTDTINFARHGAWVTAVDLTEKSLAIARQRAAVFNLQDRIRFYQANAEELDGVVPVEPYDVVYSFGVIHHTPNPDRVLEQVRRYMGPQSVLKLMVYHRYSWKVLWVLLRSGKGQFWKTSELVAKHSEAQTGCPITYIYSRKEGRQFVERHGFRVTELWVDHIFPYRIHDYKEYCYRKEWYFRWLPRPVFRKLEQSFGWHLCITAEPTSGQDMRAAA